MSHVTCMNTPCHNWTKPTRAPKKNGLLICLLEPMGTHKTLVYPHKTNIHAAIYIHVYKRVRACVCVCMTSRPLFPLHTFPYRIQVNQRGREGGREGGRQRDFSILCLGCVLSPLSRSLSPRHTFPYRIQGNPDYPATPNQYRLPPLPHPIPPPGSV